MSPLDHPQMYEIDVERVGQLLKDQLLLAKPKVVLEHLSTERAIPLQSGVRNQRKLVSKIDQCLDAVTKNDQQ